jgi:hypothetical protein
MRGTLRRAGLLFAVVVALSVGSGCATYWQNRAADFADMMDIGITVSRHTQFAFYQSFESILPLGYADFDCTVLGWGGGHFGAMHHYLKAWGVLVWGNEQVGWGDYDKDDPSTLYVTRVGLVGMPSGLITRYSNPYYVPT